MPRRPRCTFPPLLRPSVSRCELRERADLLLAWGALCSTLAAGVLASIIGGRPSPRQVQKATKRRTGQKRRAYQRRHRSHAQKIGAYFVLPIFEHGEEPPFGATEHCGSDLLG